MKRFILILTLLSIISWKHRVFSQSNYLDSEKILAEIIDELDTESGAELDISSIIDDLNDLISDPIDINSCDFETLSKLHFLTDFQLQSLWEYIQLNKPVLNIYELQLVYGFDKSDVIRLSPFIRVGSLTEQTSLKDMISKGKHEVINRVTSVLETPDGYQKDSVAKYMGNKLSVYSRYKYSFSNKMQWGLAGEKDAGEEFFKGANPYGFDFASGYIMTSNLGIFKRMVIGDFDYEQGHGLSVWTSQTFGKSFNPMSIRRRARGLKPHTSNNENRFFRGGGATLLIKNLEFTFYGSAKNIDANLTDSLSGIENYYSSLPSTGLHRTTSEILNKRRLKEYIGGACIQRNFRKAKVGLSFNHIMLDGKFAYDSSPSLLYQQIQSTKTTAGIYADFNLRGNFIFGEASVEPYRDEFAILIGGLAKLSSRAQYSIVFRKYSVGYNGLYSSGFAENSSTENEMGIYCGISISPIANFSISAYADLYRFPWLRYNVNAPSYGHDYLLQVEYKLLDKSTLLFKYRSKLGQENFDSEFSSTKSIICKESNSMRFQFSTSLEDRITFQSRFDFVFVSGDSLPRDKGYLFTQNVGYNFKKIPFTLNIRFTIYDTDSWNARVYSYDNDLPYSFSVPASYLRGSRVNAMVKYSPRNNIDFWIRWSQSYMHDQNKIGSGLDEIFGNKKNELKMMVRVDF